MWLDKKKYICKTSIRELKKPFSKEKSMFIYEILREGKSSTLNKDKREHRVDVQYNGD